MQINKQAADNGAGAAWDMWVRGSKALWGNNAHKPGVISKPPAMAPTGPALNKEKPPIKTLGGTVPGGVQKQSAAVKFAAELGKLAAQQDFAAENGN